MKMKIKSLTAVNELVNSIDVTDQDQINALKAKYPGAGIGPCVQDGLSCMIISGEINSAQNLPTEYRNQLSCLLG